MADLNPTKIQSPLVTPLDFRVRKIYELDTLLSGHTVHGINLVIQDSGRFQQNSVRLILQTEKPDLPLEPLWSSQQVGPNGSALLKLYKTNQAWHLEVCCAGKGVFTCPVGKPEINIAWEQGGTSWQHYLLSSGLAVYFEINGRACLHGDVLATNGRALGLLGGSLAGKSTFALALNKLGCRVLSDDMLVLHPPVQTPLAFPSLPIMRLWPSSIESLANTVDKSILPRVHDGHEKRMFPLMDRSENKELGSAQLKALYLLERQQPGQRQENAIIRLRPVDALVTLLQQGTLSDGVAALGIEAERLQVLAQLVESIPVNVVRYQSGFDRLESACRLVLEDFNSLPSKAA